MLEISRLDRCVKGKTRARLSRAEFEECSARGVVRLAAVRERIPVRTTGGLTPNSLEISGFDRAVLSSANSASFRGVLHSGRHHPSGIGLAGNARTIIRRCDRNRQAAPFAAAGSGYNLLNPAPSLRRRGGIRPQADGAAVDLIQIVGAVLGEIYISTTSGRWPGSEGPE